MVTASNLLNWSYQSPEGRTVIVEEQSDVFVASKTVSETNVSSPNPKIKPSSITSTPLAATTSGGMNSLTFLSKQRKRRHAPDPTEHATSSNSSTSSTESTTDSDTKSITETSTDSSTESQTDSSTESQTDVDVSTLSTQSTQSTHALHDSVVNVSVVPATVVTTIESDPHSDNSVSEMELQHDYPIITVNNDDDEVPEMEKNELPDEDVQILHETNPELTTPKLIELQQHSKRLVVNVTISAEGSNPVYVLSLSVPTDGDPNNLPGININPNGQPSIHTSSPPPDENLHDSIQTSSPDDSISESSSPSPQTSSEPESCSLKANQTTLPSTQTPPTASNAPILPYVEPVGGECSCMCPSLGDVNEDDDFLFDDSDETSEQTEVNVSASTEGYSSSTTDTTGVSLETTTDVSDVTTEQSCPTVPPCPATILILEGEAFLKSKSFTSGFWKSVFFMEH